MKILITGGAGYLGSIITETLLEGWREVTVLDNLMHNQTSVSIFSHQKNFKFVYGDVRDKELLKELVLQNDVIIPLAAIVGFPACATPPAPTTLRPCSLDAPHMSLKSQSAPLVSRKSPPFAFRRVPSLATLRRPKSSPQTPHIYHPNAAHYRAIY